MGCKASKALSVDEKPVNTSRSSNSKEQEIHDVANSKKKRRMSLDRKKNKEASSSTPDSAASNEQARLYELLTAASLSSSSGNADSLAIKTQHWCAQEPSLVQYQHPNGRTVLHAAIMYVMDNYPDSSMDTNKAIDMVQTIVDAHPLAVNLKDADGLVPLHYCIVDRTKKSAATTLSPEPYQLSVALMEMLLQADTKGACSEYWARNNVPLRPTNQHRNNNHHDDELQKNCNIRVCSPLYRLVWMLDDDSSPHDSPTVEYLQNVAQLFSGINNDNGIDTISIRRNAENFDTPLALLYRRFTRQFDRAEEFFDGDNSRPEVVQHRRRFKHAAGNTWKHVEVILEHCNKSRMSINNSNSSALNGLVHWAVQVEAPPELLRYIVETNAQDLTISDDDGNLPLHLAAQAHINTSTSSAKSLSFYSKYVIDELLYKYPEAASRPNGNGHYPLQLAVEANKSWIGGGVKSLYEAYPEALKAISLEQHSQLARALVQDGLLSAAIPNDDDTTDDDRQREVDAIMLVQQPNIDVTQVVECMWAHEEDAGVQMLGCVAVSRLAAAVVVDATEHSSSSNSNELSNGKAEIVNLALTGIPAVVNALKAHPNEVIVQEKACHALALLAPADGSDEISLVASGAVTSLVGGMQAHVSDVSVQEEASHALEVMARVGGGHRCTMIASVSGVTALVNALAAHTDQRNVQVAAISALVTITGCPTSSNVPSLARSQTEALLVAAQDSFPETHDAVQTLLSRLS